MSFKKFLVTGLLAVCLTAGTIPAVWSDEVTQAGTQVINKWHDAVITLQIVVKMTMSYDGKQGPKEEMKTDATGLVIDSSGLVVTALSGMDPNDLIHQMMPDKIDMTTEITSLKMILPDGKEIPAKIVLRDKDLDLVFIRPKQKSAALFTAVDLTKATKPAVLDQTFMLYRMGVVASRSLAVTTDRIQAIVEKPRVFYVPGAQSADKSAAVAAIFAMDSNIVGILVARVTASSGVSGSDKDIIPIIMPASDILEAANQVSDSAK